MKFANAATLSTSFAPTVLIYNVGLLRWEGKHEAREVGAYIPRRRFRKMDARNSAKKGHPVRADPANEPKNPE